MNDLFRVLDSNSTVVQKYGGTSVGTVERIQAIANKIADHHRAGVRRIAIVVSAMAGETNRFVGLVNSIDPDAPDKAYDMAVAAGEQVSVALMAAALNKAGVEAEPFLAHQVGIYTDPSHKKARIQTIRTDKILDCWEQAKVPVIAGFQGVTESMALTTLGRGGSDISAVALAVAMNADFCEIFTDVDGVFTCDPRIVPDAKLLEVLDYDTTLELAALGGKVLHSRCVEVGAKYKLPIIVKNSFAMDAKGEGQERRTVIMSYTEAQAIEAPVVSAITLDKNVAKVTLHGLEPNSASLARVFEGIAVQKINVDIIVHNLVADETTMRVGFTMPQEEVRRAVAELERMYPGSHITSRDGLAKVSVIGLGMRNESGVASRVFSELAKNSVDIVMISTSEIKISCVVPLNQGEKAAQILHQSFIP